MAWELPGLMIALEAAADLSAKQYYFVNIDATGKAALPTGATDKPIGVLQNKPTAGQTAEIMVTGVSKVSSDAALSIDNLIGTSADGQADAKVPGTDITEYVVGRVLEASGAAAGLVTAAINCLNPHRGA